VSRLLCEGIQLDVEQAGEGRPMILIHGSWSGRETWAPVLGALAQRFRVICYDRRGYGKSQRPGVGPADHVSDLLALVRTLELEQVILVGNSFGGLVAMHAVLQAGDRIGLAILHEPPLLGLLADSASWHPTVARAEAALAQSLAAARAGDNQLSAQLYVDGMASFPGTWQHLPDEIKQGFVENAPAFLADAGALDGMELLPPALHELCQRFVITRGERTSTYLKLVVDRIYAALPDVRRHVFGTGGHVPQQTCPEDFVAQTLRFVDES
jgi:pimeloyl-ACP methyl ester carboxylesterase